jgi:ankyrin repeat protein
MGVSPLLMSCHQGHRDCAMLCLASGADADDADDEGFAPVHSHRAHHHHPHH